MLDDLRDQASSFFEEEEPDFLEEEEAAPATTRRSVGFLSTLSPLQRFIIALMFMLTICLVGTMFMLVTQRFVLF